MDYKDIEKANQLIKTTDIKGKDYAEVNQRIKAFRIVYPDGSITTDLLTDSDGICIFKATVCDGDGKVLGTGHAKEKEGSSYINKTSYIENCETSAVGRALGMCGFGIDTSVASYEEVANAVEQQENDKSTPQKKASTKRAPSNRNEQTDAITKKIAEYARAHKMSMAEIAKDYKLTNENATAEKLQEVYDDLTKASTADSNASTEPSEEQFAAIDEPTPFE